ncbi:MAG: hypothetical protein GY749_12130 [Desulfobacteraceae bacterium]|nr:hypothetical protein [Desulfobacteraceae bacterium]
MICTFYSYKGGVGRSMALANVAELLYRRGLKVLMVDFDLEAPGLERYFDVSGAKYNHSEILGKRGIIDMLLSYKELRSLPKANMPQTDKPEPQDKNDFPFSVEPLKNFMVPVYEDSSNDGELYLIPPGRRAGPEFVKYAKRIHSFDWNDFYANWDGELFFEWFRHASEKIADVVLVDSRTGVTEMSGVCTYQLADVVVMFVSPNQQNMDGTVMMAESLSNPKLIEDGRKGRALSLIFAPSRIENSEAGKLNRFANEFNQRFGKYISSKIKTEKDFFHYFKIRYIPYYSYKEQVAVREQSKAIAVDLTEAFYKLASALSILAPDDSRFKRYFKKELKEIRLPEPVSTKPILKSRQYEKLSHWLDQLIGLEFQTLTNEFLPVDERNVLSQPLNRGNFIDNIQAWNKSDELEVYLKNKYPDRFEEKLTDSSHVPFVNQEEKIDIILSSYTSSYHLLDAPAGYGKTALLRKIEQELRKTHFLCGYFSINEDRQTLPKLIKAMFDKFNFGEFPKNASPGRLIADLGNFVKQKRKKNAEMQGLVFLIDLEKSDKLSSSYLIKDLFEIFIPRMQRSLGSDNFFLSGSSRFRVVIAGRYLTDLEEVRSTPLPFLIHKLSQFSYEILLHLARIYFKGNISEDDIKTISSHIMSLSGGHPGYMAVLLEKYKEGCPPPDEFLDAYKEDIREIRNDKIGHIFENTDKELRDIMEMLSPCRRFDYLFLRQFIEKGVIRADDAYDLADRLTNAYLIVRKDGFLQDDITRRLLAVRLYQDDSKKFIEICKAAKESYTYALSNSKTTRPEIIVIELLYQELQLAYCQQEQNTEETFSEAVNENLNILIADRDVQEMIDNFVEALMDDWEFQFVLNYFQRKDTYNDQPYQRLKQQINEFRQSLSKAHKGD